MIIIFALITTIMMINTIIIKMIDTITIIIMMHDDGKHYQSSGLTPSPSPSSLSAIESTSVGALSQLWPVLGMRDGNLDEDEEDGDDDDQHKDDGDL